MISLNIVAHPDDDLLFLNPDIAEDMERGDRAYIVYLTMGDDGRDRAYVNMRSDGLHHAYRDYSGASFTPHYFWIKSNSFRNGDVEGNLWRMWHHPTHKYPALLGEIWSGDSLSRMLRHLIVFCSPDLIRIQDPNCEPAIDHDEPHLDHLDHIYGAKFAFEAAKDFSNIPVWSYMGYPIRSQEPNLTDAQIELKTKMWRAYQEKDSSTGGAAWDVALTRRYKEQIQ